MQEPSLIVGIDLGTTNSAVAYYSNHFNYIVPNDLGSRLTPSAVAVDEDGQLVTGRLAKNIQLLEPHKGALHFKRMIGTQKKLTLGRHSLTSLELSSMILAQLKADASARLNTPVSRAVITVPAYFDENQRNQTKKAAELAGLKVERLINEPTAAAMAYGLHDLGDDALFMVIDLGGGTLDICVMELFDGTLQVQSTAGDNHLGGEDFTACLAALMLQVGGLSPDDVMAKDQPRYTMTLKRAELAKRQLKPGADAKVIVPGPGGERSGEQEVSLSAQAIDDCFRPFFDRMITPIREALAHAKIKRKDLEKVILVGGATRLPHVKAFVKDLLQKTPLDDIDPDLAVVRGAALGAALIANDVSIQDIVVTDVTSHSLGIETVKNVSDSKIKSGYFSTIIPRNTVIPTSKTEEFSTVQPFQKELTIKIYEGESRQTAENQKVGTISLKGLPEKDETYPFYVTFTYDISGMLEVMVDIPGEQEPRKEIIHRNGEQISAADKRQAEQWMASIKSKKNQTLNYRALIKRCEQLCRELRPMDREHVEMLMDELEALMENPRFKSESKQIAEQLKDQCKKWEDDDTW